MLCIVRIPTPISTVGSDRAPCDAQLPVQPRRHNGRSIEFGWNGEVALPPGHRTLLHPKPRTIGVGNQDGGSTLGEWVTEPNGQQRTVTETHVYLPPGFTAQRWSSRNSSKPLSASECRTDAAAWKGVTPASRNFSKSSATASLLVDSVITETVKTSHGYCKPLSRSDSGTPEISESLEAISTCMK